MQFKRGNHHSRAARCARMGAVTASHKTRLLHGFFQRLTTGSPVSFLNPVAVLWRKLLVKWGNRDDWQSRRSTRAQPALAAHVAKRQVGTQVVAAAGVEPARSCEQRILNPSRLPIPPRRQIGPRNLQDGTCMRLYFHNRSAQFSSFRLGQLADSVKTPWGQNLRCESNRSFF